MNYRMKLWAGVGAATLLHASFADKATAASAEQPVIVLAAGGEAGEAGEGGEGGEAGIDATAARTDPVVFVTALDVIRAHYMAGQRAYAAGNRTGAQELFVHPISEVYVDFKPVLEQRGGADFQALMEKAGEAAGAGRPATEIDAAARAVLAEVDKAEAFAPPGKDSVALNAAVLSEFLGRAAQQYASARKSSEEEPYLDGLGLYLVAKQRADRQLKAIAAKSPEAEKKVTAALDALAKAYPGAKPPTTKPAMPDMLAAVSAAQLALSGL